MLRFLRGLGIALAILLVAGTGVVLVAGPARFPWVMQALGFGAAPGSAAVGLVGVPVGGPFTLTDARTGKVVTDVDYRGRWMLVYFGYTFCPDVCPTDLQKMVLALSGLGANAEAITPIFITVDPARDDATTLARYVSLFSPRLVGLTGTKAEVDAAVHAYRVYAEKQPLANGGSAYFINHSAFMYLMNPQGKLAAIFPPDLKASDLTRQLARAIGAQPAG